MEIKPRFSYFPWTHTEIQDDEPCVSLHFMICYRESKQKRLDNGKWKMENGKWMTDQQRHLTIGMSVTSLHNEEEDEEDVYQ